MKKIILTLLTCTLFTTSCNVEARTYSTEELKTITKTISTEDIEGLDISGGFDVTIQYGVTPKAVVTISQYIDDKLIVKHNNDILKVSLKNKNIFKNIFNTGTNEKDSKLVKKLVITTPNFEYLSASGMTAVKFQSEFSSEDLTINLDGMSKIEGARFKITGDVTIEASGMSTISNSGITGGNSLTAECSGMSSLGLEITKNEVVDIDCSGMSNANFNLNKVGTVKADCSGMSNIGLKGDCTSVNQNSSGMSSITLNVNTNN